MSPPSLATAGRTRVSIRSLMVATVSASACSKNSSASVPPVASPRRRGPQLMKCSIMAPRIAGSSCCHSVSDLVTVMKSEPKNTPVTPAISNSRSASGDLAATSRFGRSSVPSGSTVRPGRNFRVAGFGVVSVWMNIAWSPSPSRVQGPPSQDHAIHGSFRPAGQPPAKPQLMRLGTNQTHDILDRIHGLGRDRARAVRAFGQHGIDVGLVLHQPLELAPDRTEPRHRDIDQRGLEGRELRAAELA